MTSCSAQGAAVVWEQGYCNMQPEPRWLTRGTPKGCASQRLHREHFPEDTWATSKKSEQDSGK